MKRMRVEFNSRRLDLSGKFPENKKALRFRKASLLALMNHIAQNATFFA
jgi:hypothetical protein